MEYPEIIKRAKEFIIKLENNKFRIELKSLSKLYEGLEKRVKELEV